MTLDIVQFATALDATATSSTTVTLAGCTPGNLLVMTCYVGNANTPAIGFPSGFTQQPAEASPGDGRMNVAYRVCPASPPSTWTVTHAGFASHAAVIELPPAAFDVDAYVRTNSGATVVGPTITPTAAKDAILLIVGVWLPAYSPTAWPTGYTYVFDDYVPPPSARPYVLKKLVNPTSGSYAVPNYSAAGGVVGSTLHMAYYSTGAVGGGARSSTLVVTG